MHPGLAIRVRKPLPLPPTSDQVELAYEAQVRSTANGFSAQRNTTTTVNFLQGNEAKASPFTSSDVRASGSDASFSTPNRTRSTYTGSPSNATRSPTSRAIKCPAKLQDDNFVHNNNNSSTPSTDNIIEVRKSRRIPDFQSISD